MDIKIPWDCHFEQGIISLGHSSSNPVTLPPSSDQGLLTLDILAEREREKSSGEGMELNLASRFGLKVSKCQFCIKTDSLKHCELSQYH